jgi:hypothetical protein
MSNLQNDGEIGKWGNRGIKTGKKHWPDQDFACVATLSRPDAKVCFELGAK